jgi:DNA-binding CsgD family transcriptional regulator
MRDAERNWELQSELIYLAPPTDISDRFKFPAKLLVADDMALRAINLAGRALVEASIYFHVIDGRLMGVSSAASRQLQSLFSTASDTVTRTTFKGCLLPGSGEIDWIGSSRRLGGWDNGEALTMLTFRPMTKTEPMPRAELMAHLGLSAAEADLATKLATGLNLTEIAEQNNVTVGTLRAQLRSIFSKTGTNKQASLVSLIWRMASA